jgi:hypothetical protein
MSVKKYIRKNVYRWHRVTSLLVAVPVILWTLSGFLHPVMGSFKPAVANQVLPADAIDVTRIQVPLQTALEKAGIGKLHRFRIIRMEETYYYQLQQNDVDTLTYLSCTDGSRLANGDRLYAAWLAQRYLSEPNLKKEKSEGHGHDAAAGVAALVFSLTEQKPSFKKTKLKAVDLVTAFNTAYKKSNVLLPVYCVSFERKDRIRLYIETSTGRMAAAVDSRKAWFTRFFSITHSWSFLDSTGAIKNFLLGMVSFLCFLTGLAGFYVYNLTKERKKRAGVQRIAHRVLGNIFVLTTLLYSVSGAWHSFHKIPSNEKQEMKDRAEFPSKELNLHIWDMAHTLGKKEKLTGVSPIRMDGRLYWQLGISNGNKNFKRYLDPRTCQEVADGDEKYGCYLACTFAAQNHQAIQSSRCLTQFTSRYSMMNKRLPVIEVAFENAPSYYVETSTGYLSAVTDAHDRAERFSFSNLHMHHYWEDWLGKEKGKAIERIVLISSTLGLLLLVLTGMLIYWARQLKKARPANPA